MATDGIKDVSSASRNYSATQMQGLRTIGGLAALMVGGLVAACSPSQRGTDAQPSGTAQTINAIAGNPANEALDDAASAAENLVEAVLADDQAMGGKAFDDLQKATSGLTPARLGKDAAIIGELNQSIKDGWQVGDRPAAAMAAVSLYARLVQAKDWNGAKVPLAVSMLDHAGFKSELLVAQDQIDWASLRQTAAEAQRDLASIESKITDSNLKQVARGIVWHMDQGVKAKDPARVTAAAKDLLAVVDLLEQQFERQIAQPKAR